MSPTTKQTLDAHVALIARIEAVRDNALAEARRLAVMPEDEGEVGRTYAIERQLDDVEAGSRRLELLRTFTSTT